MRKIEEIRALSDSTRNDVALSDAEADELFADLAAEPAFVLAVSGGPDSTALMFLAARWRSRRNPAPRLCAVTIDHGLRPEARREADAVKRLAEKLGVAHRTMRWSGAKPSTGLQEKARAARYQLLDAAARAAKARCVLTAHTLDDQAETVLFRMARGSGLAGLGGMARMVPFAGLLRPELRAMQPAESAGFSVDADGGAGRLPAPDQSEGGKPRRSSPIQESWLVRPFLDLPKTRLIATLRQAGIAYAADPSNDDPRFARTRLRKLMPMLAAEGLTTRRLANLARRVRRSESAIEAAVDAALKAASERLGPHPDTRRIAFDANDLRAMPAEIGLRLLGRAVSAVGNEGPVELAKLEALSDGLAAAMAGAAMRFRRTLAGAMVSLQRHAIIIERAPARRHPPGG
jgi:tRNA(Ile)-lysidine synthase